MSQNTQILNYLKRHPNGLTQLQAVDKFGCYRLGARIYDLKTQGHPIGSHMVEKNGKRFARYFYGGAA